MLARKDLTVRLQRTVVLIAVEYPHMGSYVSSLVVAYLVAEVRAGVPVPDVSSEPSGPVVAYSTAEVKAARRSHVASLETFALDSADLMAEESGGN